MTARLGAFVAMAVMLATLFVYLGFWQLDRRRERQAENAIIERQLAAEPLPLRDLPHTRESSNRRVAVDGVADLEHEVVLTGRSRNGSPGVHILTPIRAPGSDSAVLVNRGWVYAADAATVDLARWRENRVSWTGYVLEIPEGASTARGRGMRLLRLDAIRQLIPYPVLPVYVVAQDSTSEAGPARIPLPELNDGPHLSYAVQWFCFAAIALVGAIIVIRRSKAAGSTAA